MFSTRRWVMTDADGRQTGRPPISPAGSVSEGKAMAVVVGYPGGLGSIIGREE
jgi:hypothetical protein